jgi:hypothetical protein
MVAKNDAAARALEQRYVRSERMVGRRIAGEYILVPIVGHGADLDAIYNVNALGAFIWEHLDGKAAGADVVNAIVDQYDVGPADAARDFSIFLAQLLAIRAVTVAEGPGPADGTDRGIVVKEE